MIPPRNFFWEDTLSAKKILFTKQLTIAQIMIVILSNPIHKQYKYVPNMGIVLKTPPGIVKG